MTTLKAALQEAYFVELEELPSEEELSEDEALTFSSAFERKMKKLIRRADHPIRYRIAQIAACLLLAALLSGCTVLAVSPEARAAFVGWMRETYETWFVYRYAGEDKAISEDVVYRPTWLPEGYLQAFVPELSDQVNVLYTNGDGPMIIFAYSSSSSALTLHIQGDTAVLSRVTVNGIPADFYLEEDGIHSNCLVWENSQNDIIYWIVANLPKDTIIKIAESVEEVQ